MPGISVHVIDVAHGIPASGMRVQLCRLDGERHVLADRAVGPQGSLPIDDWATAPMPAGRYEALFHVGAYYLSRREALPTPAFLDVVTFQFGIAEPTQHYHLPMKVTPWGFSLFRGGA
jgi:5-hydroxyisourate hydrolase